MSKRFGETAGRHCADENARRNESVWPAAIFVGYSVISSIQRMATVFELLEALWFEPPMVYCLLDGICGLSFEGPFENA